MNTTNIFVPKRGIGQAKWVVIAASLMSAIAFMVPALHFIAYPFLLLSTLVHEMGHGVAAVIAGGHFVSFQMWVDGSGVAKTSGSFGRLSQAFIAAAGLVGPAIVAGLSFCVIKSPKASRFFLGAFGTILALALLLVVRNLFGVIFVSAMCALCYLFSFGPFKTHAQVLLAFLGMQLALSVFSRGDYLFVDEAHTSMGIMPSDVAQIAQALILPYWFWGALCGIFSVLVMVFGIRQFFK